MTVMNGAGVILPETIQREQPEENEIPVDSAKEIMNKKATKWNGIQLMLSAMGVSPEETVYFGDDNDDIEPLENCGTGVALANAIEAVKEAADVVTESNDEDGVARWIEREIINE